MIKTFLVDNCTFNGCNKGCLYCRKDKKIKGSARAVNHSLSLLEESVIGNVLKISGYGEITLLDGWKKTIEEHGDCYERIQIITHGANLSRKDIDWLASRSHSLCISLDGVTVSSNSSRNSSEAELKKIVENMKYAASLGLSIEVNTVLTRFNINDLEPHLAFIAEIGGLCYLFPVRENRLYAPGDSLKPSKQEAEKSLGKLIDRPEEFIGALPPKAYLESLREFMLRESRGICHVPEVVMGISPEGYLLKCPCGGTERVSNIFSGGKNAFERYAAQRKSEGYNPECQDCFTHYEVFNLFLEGRLSSAEMNRLPLLKDLNLSRLRSSK